MNTYNKNKSKAISSYLLSGINIKKLIQQQLNQDHQTHDPHIVKINRKPIFRIKQKQNNQASLSSSINNSFKIRSLTKKSKDPSCRIIQQSTQIFQKVQNLRNYKNNSNRMQLLINISHLSKQYKEFKESLQITNSKQIPLKIKEIKFKDRKDKLQFKCKVGNQIFIKQVLPKIQQNQAIIKFSRIGLQKYKDIAYKIHTHYNDKYKQNHIYRNHQYSSYNNCNRSKTLIIISIQALTSYNKKTTKHSLSTTPLDEQQPPSKQHPTISKPILNIQQLQLLKQFSHKHNPKDPLLESQSSSLKIAYKVNNHIQLNQLKSLLEQNHINYYYCIFYPIKKHVECNWLYSIDPLLEQVQNVVILESKYKIHAEMPVLTSQVNTLFLQTYFDTIMILNRTINALKAIIYHKIKDKEHEVNDFQINSIQTQEAAHDCYEQRQNRSEMKPRIGMVQSQRLSDMKQFCIKSQSIKINMAQFNAKLDQYYQSKLIKGLKNNKKPIFYENQRKKRTILGQRQSNIPLISQPYLHQSSKNNLQINKPSFINMPTCQQIKQNLLQYFQKANNKNPNNTTYNNRRQQIIDKNDQLQELTNNIKFNNNKNKDKGYIQLISQLSKRNLIINKQINSFIGSTIKWSQSQRNNHNLSIEYFNDGKDQNGELNKCYASTHGYVDDSSLKRDEVLQIIAYKIF